MSVIRTLEHFTQDEVDNAVTETLAKDLPYGGNRPYVIGTILRDPTTGEYLLWRKGGTEEHRLCIEHAPNEFVEWRVATETMTYATITPQQLTRGYPFAKIKRVGMIPLDAASSSVPSTYYDSAHFTSRQISSPGVGYPIIWFTLDPGKCKMMVDQTTPSTQPTYCEPDALLYEPFFTDKVYFINLHVGYSTRGVVFYCVYELNDGLFHYPMSDLKHEGQYAYRYHPFFKVNISAAYLKNVCVNGFDYVDDNNYNVRMDLWHLRPFNSSSDMTWGRTLVWSQDVLVNNKTSFYNADPLNEMCYYGTFLNIEFESNFNFRHRGAEAWFRFTSSRFNS
jgi:hypothetical protein